MTVTNNSLTPSTQKATITFSPSEGSYMDELKTYFNQQEWLKYRDDRDVVFFHYDREGVPTKGEPSITKRKRITDIFKLIQGAPAASNLFEAFQLIWGAFTYLENKVFSGAGAHIQRMMPPEIRTIFQDAKTGITAFLGHKEAILVSPEGAISAYTREPDIFDPPFNLHELVFEKPNKNGNKLDKEKIS